MGSNHGLDVSTNIKIPDHFDLVGIQKLYQVIHNSIGHVLMEYLIVSESIDIELQRLELDAELIRHIANADGGKIREAGSGANAGELRALKTDFIAPNGRSVFKTL